MKIPEAKKNRGGFTLIDSLLSIIVVASMILIFTSLLNARLINRRVTFRSEAAALVDEEINALKRVDVTTLTTQTNGAFKNVLYNAGKWSIATNSSNLDNTSSPCPTATSGQHCGSTVVEQTAASGYSGKESGRLLFPAGAYSTATLQADLYVGSDSPSGWAAGYWLQASDKNNGYRLRLGATGTDLSAQAGTHNLVLDKLVGGTSTELFVKAVTFSTNTWYNLKVVLDPNGSATIKIYLNSTQQDTGTITDTTYTSGAAGILAWGGVHLQLDDALTTTTATSRWNFEGSTILPTAWTRLSLNDLPDGTTTLDDNGLLTIAAYPNVNSTTLKQVTVTVQWSSGSGTSNYSVTTLIGNSGVGS